MASRSKKRDFVRVGWFSLHESVLLAGAEIDSGPFFGEPEISLMRWLDSDSYSALLGPIVKVTDVFIQSPSDNADQVSNEIWACIRRLKKQQPIPSNAFSRISLQGFVAAYKRWTDDQPDIRDKEIFISSPLDAATVGWELVQHAAQHNDRLESLFWGLGILGWVTTIYSELRICRYCFRWSVPGSPFCFAHTQSMPAAESGGKGYVRYRIGAKVFALAQQRGIQIQHDRSIVDDRYRQTLLAEYLFFNLPSDSDGVDLRQALHKSPRVLGLLGGIRVLSMSNKRLFRLVREQLNPMEMFPSALILNVSLAENIFSLEEEKKPGRPSGKRTKRQLMMIDKATSMFKDGARPSEVAAKLKVTRTAVSNWIRRYEEVRCAYSPPPYPEQKAKMPVKKHP